jgi:hypothetical protein
MFITALSIKVPSGSNPYVHYTMEKVKFGNSLKTLFINLSVIIYKI